MDKIFGSRLRAKVLAWFFFHADEEFFVRQLAGVLDEDSTNLSRELSKLEQNGILLSTKKGNLKYFQVNKQCTVFSELKGLILKTYGVVGELKSNLKMLAGIKFAFIYGSFAKGEEKAHSDIDIMLIGEIELDDLDPLIDALEKKIGRSINYTTYDQVEFSHRKKTRDGFISGVLKEKKIMLVGGEPDLTRA